MTIAAIAGTIFAWAMIALQLLTGFAVIGWTGDNMVVERETAPGPFWFAIVLQTLIALGLSSLITVSFVF